MRNHSIRRGLVAVLVLLMASTALVIGPAAADSNSVGPLPTEKAFVDRQYQDFLGRTAEPSGLQFWTNLIKSGAPSSDIVEALATSPEFEGRVAPVVRLYYAYFDRSPDFNGLNFWVGFLRGGASMERVSQEFSLSQEFTNTYGSLTDGEFVNLVYTNVLGRSADAAGRNYWLGEMAKGVSRGRVMLAFSDSAEYRNQMQPVVQATMLYVGLLRRQPEQKGLEYWTGVLRGGGSYAAVIGGFIDSAEYRARINSIYTKVHPLTGEIAVATNPGRAMAVKVDNHNDARPQHNLQFADIVFEEEVEFNISRFIAIYHSEIPGTVGPTRSVRTTDFGVLGAFNQPVLVSSGGNPTVLKILGEFEANGTVINRNEKALGSAYFRNNSRVAPHNLYARTSTVLDSVTQGSAPQQIFRYRQSGIPSPKGKATNGVRINYGRNDVNWAWNPTLRGWVRTQNGVVHRLDDGTTIAPDNVVVMEMKHQPSIADAKTPEAISAGSGLAHIFTDGKYISGIWVRPAVGDTWELKDHNGEPILLTPGETYVNLARPEIITVR